MHDYTMLLQELDVNLGLLQGYKWRMDLGYLGVVAAYTLRAASLPHRKPRRSKRQPLTCLTPRQRRANYHHARQRVKVEHALAGSKRLGAVSQVCRNKTNSFTDRLMALACGIWNWFLQQAPNRI